ncbi:MAG: hypothetical protein QNJ37_11275 [Crocosphaera sp.]|nr:hypothetical protein [Crocosphaera sp.]
MTHPKPSNSSFRYFVAGLKPLANAKIWGSIGIIALVTFALWQYSRHPEWVGSNQAPSPVNGGEFEAEVGNSVDIGVTVQDLEATRLNSQGFPVPSTPITPNSLDRPLSSPQGKNPTLKTNQNAPVPFPSLDKDNADLNQPSPSVKFEPLMPNVKNLGGLFPPLTPSKDSRKPIKLPDSELDRPPIPQDTPLGNAIDNVFSQESPSNVSPQNNNQPLPSSVKPIRPTNPSSVTSPRSNPYPSQTNPSNQPFNNPYTYSPPQPYRQPYGNGRSPAPIPAYPPSPQFPNGYGNRNPNASTRNNQPQAQPQPNYGIQPPQVDQYGY